MTKPTKILIVEDEAKIAALLSEYLEADGHETQVLLVGDHAVELAATREFDLLVLDLMLPGKDGLSICKEVRQFSDLPIVMVTARVDEIDRLLGLELGADDYICKPFSPREVVVRVRNILRRVAAAKLDDYKAQDQKIVRYGKLLLDEARLACSYDEIAISLTVVEFRLLKTMAEMPGRIFKREQLMNCAYEDHRIVSDRTIDTHIKNLRKKFADIDAVDLIHSIYGLGYKVE
ncbi:MAG: response regulator [Pseudomonadota bacterium]